MPVIMINITNLSLSDSPVLIFKVFVYSVDNSSILVTHNWSYPKKKKNFNNNKTSLISHDIQPYKAQYVYI